MCNIRATIERRANDILNGAVAPTRASSGSWYEPPDEEGWWSELLHYANLVLATNTELERAQTYLKDTGSPGAATGRLLLRAAERSLREYGDTPNGEKEGD